MRKPGALPIRGDVAIHAGVDGLSMIIEAFDLAGVLKMRTEMALELYDQRKVDRFAANWRRRMHRRRPTEALHLVKP
jgi:hypothetical protein